MILRMDHGIYRKGADIMEVIAWIVHAIAIAGILGFFIAGVICWIIIIQRLGEGG